MIKDKRKTVFVMLSGGVDSSVAAYLLKKQGYRVVGVYFKRFKPTGDRSWCKEDGLSAEKVAKTLGIEFKVYDLEKEYKEKVFNYFIDSYKKGFTPNPDIICNREIKFGEFVKRAMKDGADFVASGHYADIKYKIQFSKINICVSPKIYKVLNRFFHIQGTAVLSEAKDKQKDQSYFLSQINPEVLPKIIFPLANYKKSQTRKLAKQIGLHTAQKKDSQGICFIGRKVSIKKFLSYFIEEKEGKVFDLSGKHIGYHRGAYFYTVGERRGFRLLPNVQSDFTPAYYVIAKDVHKNALIVGTKTEFDKWNESIDFLELQDIVKFQSLEFGKEYFVRIRHRGKKYKAILLKDNEKTILKFLKEKAFAPAKGQFAALYDKHNCIVASAKISKVVSRINTDEIFQKIDML